MANLRRYEATCCACPCLGYEAKDFIDGRTFGALDAQTRILMQETLTQLWQDNKTTVLFVTHDIDESLLLADRIILMAGHPGRIAEDIQVNLPRDRTIENIAPQQEFIETKNIF